MADIDRLQELVGELTEISSRIDERVNTLIGRQEHVHTTLSELTARVRDLELQAAVLSRDTSTNTKTFDKIFEIGFKVVATVVGGLLLFKLGSMPH